MNQTKLVGVVIPIYNVEKYLRECLDSVVNQTYKNLQIILVNDGSTDENSLNIAKEYTLKDERFILFDKKNGGQSTARNVGIEYFSGEYKLKNITTQIKENSLIEFELDGNNHYEIHKVYKSYKAFNNENDLINFTHPNIDYIIFLDSDDYWELNCIEECVPRMDGVEIVWFDYNNIYDDYILDNKTDWTWFNCYNNYFNKKIISSKEWVDIYLKVKHFAFVWQGMIDFNYLKKIKLKFIDYIIHQDVMFGFILFVNSNFIYFLDYKKLYYRIRKNATTIRKNDCMYFSLPEYINFISDKFDNAFQLREYYSIYSWSKMIEFVLKSNINTNDDYSFKLILPSLCVNIYQKEVIRNDPLHIDIYIKFSKAFMSLINFNEKILLNNQFDLYKHSTAKARIQSQLSYKLGQTMIINSKSILGIISMPIYLLSTLISYKQERKIYQEKIKKDPSLILPPLQNYPDFKEALKYKNHLSYKLGQALIKSSKTWYKGGYIKFLFEIRKLKKEFKKKNI